ncbi:MAG: acetylornithine deacetylase [Lewinella sp.]|uniref:acetylornithine deacetylase n=1 Tax=Lewinella sp. TaxID=2004506 RepID=UPI003D6AB565
MNAQEILAQLVSFPVLGGESNLTILKWITDYLDKYGVSYQLVPNEEGNKASLHARIGPAVNDGIILSGHMDVVPVEGQDWHTDPFVLTEKDGKLYGRGSCDMKAYLACVLAIVPKMVKAKLKRPIYLAFSYDEEVGCVAAPELIQAITDFYEEQPKYAIIGEPSELQPVVGQKGICVYKTTVYGSAGHSSRIRNEVSAIHEAARLVIWLEDKMNALVDAGHTDDRFIPNHTSLHVGMFNGGIAHNVIADECSFLWDVRNIPRDKIEDIHLDFEAHCAKVLPSLRERFAGAKIKTEMYHPLVPALDTPEHLDIVPLIQQLSGVDQLQTVAYAAEAGQFSEGGYQSVICGPGSIAQAHRANEFVSIEQMVKGVAFIERILTYSCE